MPEELKPRFDMTIRLDHLLTLIAVLLVILLEWNPHQAALDKRISLLEQQSVRQQQIDAAQDQRLREELNSIHDAVRRIEDKLDSRRGIGQ